jgi:hypothetical protein
MSFIEVMITDLCNLTLESGFSDSLNKTLGQYSAGANNTIVNLMKNSVFAVGAALLTLFMLMELVTMVNRANGGENGLGSIKLPANVMIKFAIFAFLFCHIPAVLNGIEATAVSLGNSMVTGANFGFGVGVSTTQVNEIANAIENLDFFNKIFTYIVVFVCWLFIHIVEGIISITTVFRAFELWLLLLFSPIPLATIASQEFRQTAINFLKTFTAVSLQGAAIIACFLIYQALMSSFITDYNSSMDISQFINSFLLQNILYTAVLAVSVFSSGKIIKQIMNAV